MPGRKGRIQLWDLGSGLELEKLRGYLEETFGGHGLACPPPTQLFPPERAVHFVKGLMPLRITHPGRPNLAGRRYSRKELNAVARVLKGGASAEDLKGASFSGIALQNSIGARMGPDRFRDISIVLTSVLPCTWERNEGRYHPRPLLCGYPSLLSTTGAVEGPAKPRGYHVARMMGLSEDEARRKYSGHFLVHDDPRLLEVAKGLAAQAVFYSLTGEPFCERETCRLFNAQWQEQLVKAQVEYGKICGSHFSRIRKG